MGFEPEHASRPGCGWTIGCLLCRPVSLFCLFFFFSSRRRHTRSDRDWSSDVCSSDLLVTRRAVRVRRNADHLARARQILLVEELSILAYRREDGVFDEAAQLVTKRRGDRKSVV